MGPYGSSGNIVYLSWRRFVRSRSGRQFLFLRIRKRIGGEIPVAKVSRSGHRSQITRVLGTHQVLICHLPKLTLSKFRLAVIFRCSRISISSSVNSTAGRVSVCACKGAGGAEMDV